MISWARTLLAIGTLVFTYLPLSSCSRSQEPADGSARAGESPGIESVAAGHGLTNRETEVAVCITKGLSNKQIEDESNISASTVKNHVYNIFGKVGVNCRTQLMGRLFEKPDA